MPNITVERFKRLPQDMEDEWQGGVFALPITVEGPDGEPCRPSFSMWVSLAKHRASDASYLEEGGDPLRLATDSLLAFGLSDAICSRPGQIRVGDAALAAYLRKKLRSTGIHVEHAESCDELQSILNALRDYLSGESRLPAALDARGVTVSRMRSFAEAAAAFYEAQPWAELTDEDLLVATRPKPPAGMGACVVLGAGGEAFGLGFFKSASQFQRMQAADDPAAFMDRHSTWSFTYGPAEALPPADADLWEQHDLPVADPEAYPFCACFPPKAGVRRPDAKRLAYLEGLLRAISLTKPDDLDAGRWSVKVPTHDGPAEYHLALVDMPDHALDDVSALPSTTTDPMRSPPAQIERSMASIQRLIDREGFDSIDDVNDYLKALPGDPTSLPGAAPDGPSERAQELIYEAWEARGRRRRKLARQALDIWPDCADAYVVLAEMTSDASAACELFKKGVEAGKRTIGVETFKQESGHFWGILETRPYMRARLGLALCLWSMGEQQAAVSHYQALLRLNPQDNQGIRYLLAACLLEMERTKELDKLLADYDEDTAQWRYLRAIAAFRREGDSPAARERLKEALKSNRYVPDFLLGRRGLPPVPPASFSCGSLEEAVCCAEELQAGWRRTPGATQWLHRLASKK